MPWLDLFITYLAERKPPQPQRQQKKSEKLDEQSRKH